MFGAMKNGASAYANINVETGVTAASPHKLIMMLFDGTLVSVAAAKRHMQGGEIAPKGEAISRAISIIENGLRASLDKSAGGELAQNLDSLYGYVCTRLLMANLNNQPEVLDEVHKLLKELRDAWEAIEPQAAEAPQTQPAQTAPASAARAPYDMLTPANHHFVKA
jgi:flagellar protein FliS